MWRFGFVLLCDMLRWPYFDWPCNTFDHPTLSQAAENTHSHYFWGFGPKLSQVHLGEQHNSLEAPRSTLMVWTGRGAGRAKARHPSQDLCGGAQVPELRPPWVLLFPGLWNDNQSARLSDLNSRQSDTQTVRPGRQAVRQSDSHTRHADSQTVRQSDLACRQSDRLTVCLPGLTF